MSQIVYLNGDLIPIEKAKVSVLDYGFLYGYGLFETVRAYDGHVFRLVDHLKRLTDSMKKLSISAAGLSLEKAVVETLRANKLSDARVRIAVSIGEGRMVPDPSRCGDPIVLVLASDYKPYPNKVYKKGFKAIVSSIHRNSQSPLSGMKTTNYLESLLARQEARRAGVSEAILLNDKDLLAEASMSNIFVVSGGMLVTPHKESGVLPGITRQVVLELASQLKIAIAERKVTREEFVKVDEAFLTNSIMEVMPLVEVDGKPIGSGTPGLVTEKLMQAYKEAVSASMTSG